MLAEQLLGGINKAKIPHKQITRDIHLVPRKTAAFYSLILEVTYCARIEIARLQFGTGTESHVIPCCFKMSLSNSLPEIVRIVVPER